MPKNRPGSRYYFYLFGPSKSAKLELSDGTINWSVTDLASEGETGCITTPAELEGDESDELVAADRLARELKRMAHRVL